MENNCKYILNMKHIIIKYNSKDYLIDITVPFTFVFKCRITKREWRKETENVTEGYYIFESYIDLTAEQIMKGWYPEETNLCFKDNDLTICIPLCNLECKYAEK